MNKSRNKPGSLLKIKHFSDSESEDDNEVIQENNQDEDDEDMEENKSEDDNESIQENNQDEEGENMEEGNNSDDDFYQLDPDEANDNEHKPSTSNSSKKQKKPRKKGIIYIGSIPPHMNVAICRELMEQFGEVGRIFLQPDRKGMTKKANKKKKNVTFIEGWVEFERKKVAKFVAQHINNTPISTKKGSRFCDMLWSLKYLPGFKWIHLSERLTYEHAVQHQKLQLALSKARREAAFFSHNLDKEERRQKIEKKKKNKKQNK